MSLVRTASHVIDTETGNHTTLGGTGVDWTYAGATDDTLRGNGHNDQLHGGTGDDTVRGGDRTDRVYGGAGDDTVRGGDRTDHLDAGPDTDTCTQGETTTQCENHSDTPPTMTLILGDDQSVTRASRARRLTTRLIDLTITAAIALMALLFHYLWGRT